MIYSFLGRRLLAKHLDKYKELNEVIEVKSNSKINLQKFIKDLRFWVSVIGSGCLLVVFVFLLLQPLEQLFLSLDSGPLHVLIKLLLFLLGDLLGVQLAGDESGLGQLAVEGGIPFILEVGLELFLLELYLLLLFDFFEGVFFLVLF